MTRLAGLFRPAASRDASAEATLRGMLARHDGTAELAILPHGALGLVSPPGRMATGGLCETATAVVAIDGRVANASNLRAELPPLQPGDAALVAAVVERHGLPSALKRLAGDFALAVLDRRAGRLWLARDRFGVRPLYWTPVPGGVAFASQPRSLLGLPGIPVDPDPGFVARFAASHYRTFDNDPEASPFRAIRQVPAGSALRIDADGVVTPVRYWRLEDRGDIDRPEGELAEIYRAHLIRAVGQRLPETGRAVFTLSGGLDSSSVLCSAATVTDAPQQAASCVYTDAVYDEREEIRDVVEAKVERWHAVELGNEIDVAGIVARLVRLHDEPVATATWLSHLLLAERMAGEGFTTLFGGLGGDELNAGEYEYFPMHFADLKAAGDEAALAHEIDCWARHHDHPVHRKDAATAAAMMARLTDPTVPGLCRPDRARMLRYANVLQPGFFDLPAWEPVMDRPFASYLKNRAYQDMFRETLPCCLRAQDRHGAALGIETVNPFLDHELVEFMFRVGGKLKIRDGVTKQLLRRATVGILPEATRTRVKKTGWNAPAHVWFSRRSLADLRDRVRSAKFRERGIYAPDQVMSVIDDHVRIVESGVAEDNHMMFLWQLLNLDSWLDTLPEIAAKQS